MVMVSEGEGEMDKATVLAICIQWLKKVFQCLHVFH